MTTTSSSGSVGMPASLKLNEAMTAEEHARKLLIQADDLRKQARSLLLESDRKKRLRQKEKESSMLCQCGHVSGEHTEDGGPNYSAGVCRKCPCMHFLLSRAR